jgi:hypothetical protein
MDLILALLSLTLACGLAALVCPNVGEGELLDKMLKDALSVDESYTLKLYSAVAPAISEATVAGDFTECTFTGYVAKTLTRAGWAAATIGDPTYTTYAQQSWSPTTSQTVIGYWVIGVTSTTLLWCEAFAAPRTVQNGDTLNLTPRMELA